MSNNTVPFIINGQECNAHSTFDVVSPATGEKTHQGGIATEADAIAAVNAAAKAFASWRNVLSKDRREILLRAAKILIERQAELATYMIDEIGSSQQYANQSIVKSAELIKDVAGRICSLQGDFPACGSPDLSAMVTKVPYGVIFAIAPWLVVPYPSCLA
jgi:acyl-CoA reductase-like NAD-dependent aldehyde dehydrogenase